MHLIRKIMKEMETDKEKTVGRLGRIVDFCRLIDREKFIRRRTYLTDGQRFENDAEHAWHLAVMALLLRGYANEEVDLLRVVSIVLIHDLVEIYAGDTFAYDKEGLKTQKQREAEAADRLFPLLPDDLAAEMRGLWDEFEADETPEAHFAHTLDNFQPMMLQAAFIYYGTAQVFGINLGMWSAAIIIVSVNTGAYMAETVRGGILSIDPGQREGARAIGMSQFQTMLLVILPQSLRNIMPQIGNNLIINIKDTCVLSIIGTVELFFTFRSISGALYTYFEAATVTMIIYFILTFACSRLLRWIENRMDGPANFDLATGDTLAFTSGLVRYDEKRGGTH